MNQAEVRIHFPLCDKLGEEYLGYIGIDGDYLVFDRPKGGKILIHRDDFMNRHKERSPRSITP